jgi:C-terminal processing protease CtpA/Prc
VPCLTYNDFMLLLLLVAIDGDDVTNMVIAEITAMMASRAGRERKLTVLRDTLSSNARNFIAHQETKHEGSP